MWTNVVVQMTKMETLIEAANERKPKTFLFLRIAWSMQTVEKDRLSHHQQKIEIEKKVEQMTGHKEKANDER